MNSISVILTDDDPHMLFFLQHSFKSIGVAAEVNRLKNGELLIESLTQNPTQKVDCILLDLNMPRKSGRETLDEMREKGLGQGIPVIVLSHASLSDEDIARLGTHFLEKPIGLEEYKVFVKKIISIVSENKQPS